MKIHYEYNMRFYYNIKYGTLMYIILCFVYVFKKIEHVPQ